jgi:hypothetical protein
MKKFATLMQSIARCLSPDLLKPEWRSDDPNPVAGHCYLASEVCFHMVGGKEAGFKSMFIRHEGGPHWWIKGPKGEILDVTVSQFETPVPYEQSRGKGFLTRQPSKRAITLMQRVRAL